MPWDGGSSQMKLSHPRCLHCARLSKNLLLKTQATVQSQIKTQDLWPCNSTQSRYPAGKATARNSPPDPAEPQHIPGHHRCCSSSKLENGNWRTSSPASEDHVTASDVPTFKLLPSWPWLRSQPNKACWVESRSKLNLSKYLKGYANGKCQREVLKSLEALHEGGNNLATSSGTTDPGDIRNVSSLHTAQSHSHDLCYGKEPILRSVVLHGTSAFHPNILEQRINLK